MTAVIDVGGVALALVFALASLGGVVFVDRRLEERRRRREAEARDLSRRKR